MKFFQKSYISLSIIGWLLLLVCFESISFVVVVVGVGVVESISESFISSKDKSSSDSSISFVNILFDFIQFASCSSGEHEDDDDDDDDDEEDDDDDDEDVE